MHQRELSIRCRFCGTTELANSSDGKEHYKLAFLEVYNIDIDQDLPDVHPQAMCRLHEMLLEKYLNAREFGGTFKTSVGPLIFAAHREDGCCNICNEVKTKGWKQRLAINLRLNAQLTRDFPVRVNEKIGENMAKLLLNSNDKSKTIESFLEHLSDEQRQELAYCVASREGRKMYMDSEEISDEYLDLQYMEQMDLGRWLSARNACVLAFLQGSSGCGKILEETSERDRFRLAVIIEQLYRMRSSKRVFPWSFLVALNIYKKTGSKEVINTLAAAYSTPTYYVLQNWLKEQGGKEVEYPKGLTMNVFDNEQAIGRRTGVHPSNRARCSVVTNVAVCTLDAENTIQQDDSLKPSLVFQVPEGSVQGINFLVVIF